MGVAGERQCQIMLVNEAERERMEDGIFFCLGMQSKGEEEVEG